MKFASRVNLSERSAGHFEFITRQSNEWASFVRRQPAAGDRVKDPSWSDTTLALANTIQFPEEAKLKGYILLKASDIIHHHPA